MSRKAVFTRTISSLALAALLISAPVQAESLDLELGHITTITFPDDGPFEFTLGNNEIIQVKPVGKTLQIIPVKMGYGSLLVLGKDKLKIADYDLAVFAKGSRATIFYENGRTNLNCVESRSGEICEIAP